MFWGGSQIKFGIANKGWVFGAIGCVLSKLVALEIERTLASFVTVGMEKRSFDEVLGWYQVPDKKFLNKP